MRTLYTFLLALFLVSITFAQNETATPTPTPTAASTPTPTPVETSTVTPTPTTTPAGTPTPTATATETITPTPTPTAQCSATTDAVCSNSCYSGNDYDCCVQQPNYVWKDGGCAFVSTSTCPQILYPFTDFCSNGQITQKYDSQGCVTGYECVQFTEPSCAPISKPTCPDGSGLQPKFGSNGCVIEYVCLEYPGTQCPGSYEPVCGNDGKTYSNDCYAKSAGVDVSHLGPCESKPFCGNYMCDIGEDQNNCPQDCGLPIPQGCSVEKDVNGFEKYICEGEFSFACHAAPYDAEKKCSEQGGTFTTKTDPAGCAVPQCEFAGVTSGSPFQGPAVCQSFEELSEIQDKCVSVGLPAQISLVGKNCKIARCGHKEENACHEISSDVKTDVANKCNAQSLGVISSFDNNGCPILQCAAPHACQRNVPKEAYDVCRRQGGELVVKHGHNGCVSFVDCIHRGDESDVFVEEISDVPKPTELLSIVFKLEELRIEFDKLARQTDQIADYYKSVGSGEEERYRRVADMFETAKDKIDEIKDTLRAKVDDLTVDDMLEVRHDIKYIKDVIIKDIVYFMLSTGDEVKEVTSKETKDCGSRGECFDRAFRVCKPVIFYPEGRSGPRIEVVGLEGDVCVMNASMSEEFGPPPGVVPGVNPPYEMTCKIKNYALGVYDPEEDMFPYCTGNMVELIKKYGTHGNVPGVLEGSGQQFSPPEGYEQGGFQQGVQQGFQQGIQPGFQQGVQKPPLSGVKCPDGICDEFEKANPNACPQDCVGQSGVQQGGF